MISKRERNTHIDWVSSPQRPTCTEAEDMTLAINGLDGVWGIVGAQWVEEVELWEIGVISTQRVSW